MRSDEQIISVLTRLRITGHQTQLAQTEWEKLLDGLRNNRPEVLEEWMIVGAAKSKRSFREKFGALGDAFRHAGYGAIKIGPITKNAIDRFQVKLAKAIYFKHTNQILDGDVYIRHVDGIAESKSDNGFQRLVEFAPELVVPNRGKTLLIDQFAYRTNYNAELGAMYAVVKFNEQMIFQIFAIRKDLPEKLSSFTRKGEQHYQRQGIFQHASDMFWLSAPSQILVPPLV